MKKRTQILLALACVLALLIPLIALAENNAYSLLVAAEKLALKTHNVSLKAQATFKYDGELFKTFTGEYKQDDFDSYMHVSLDTPRADGTVYTGGFTVVGNGDKAYSNDTYQGNYFVTHSAYPNNTLITGSTLLSAGITTLQYAATALSSVLDDVIKQTPVDGGTRYDVSMNGAPDLINGALTYIALKYINDNYYSYSSYGSYYAQLEYEDWDALYAHYYRKVTGAEMPMSFIDQAMEADYEDPMWNLYVSVYDQLWQEAQNAQQLYDSGVVYMHKDGTHEWFSDMSDYLRAAGIDYVYYTDYNMAFASYFESVTGTPYTDEVNKIIMSTSNSELWEAYIAMTADMDAMYKQLAAQDPEVVAIRVETDGTYELLKSVVTTGGDTVTQKMLKTLDSIKIGDVNASFTLDGEGNYTSGAGAVSLIITDKLGVEHALEIDFDAQAYDYGATEVKQFNAEDYGFLTYEEYYDYSEESEVGESFDYEEYCNQLRALPKTIEFNGVSYDTMIVVEGEG